MTEQREYTALGADRPSRAAAYRELFTVDMDAELLDEIQCNLNQCRAFGADRFKEEIEAALQRHVRLGSPGRPKKKSGGKDGSHMEIAV